MTTIDHDVEHLKKQGNAAIGERIHTLMWRTGRTQTSLAAVLRVDQGSVSKRLRGKTAWTAFEVLVVAAWLNMPVTDLLPEMEACPPDPSSQGAWDGDPDSVPTRDQFWDLRISIPELSQEVSASAA